MATVEERLQKLEDDAERAQLDARAKALIETAIKINSAVYSSAMAYTNLIIGAGYAAAFAVWNFTKALLPEWATLLVSILLIISAAGFVAFECFKMIINAASVQSMNRVLKPGLSSGEVLEAFNEYQTHSAKLVMRVMSTWLFILPFVMITGFGAILILLGNLVGALFSHLSF